MTEGVQQHETGTLLLIGPIVFYRKFHWNEINARDPPSSLESERRCGIGSYLLS